MKRVAMAAISALAFALVGGAVLAQAQAQAQATFKIPFPFEAGGKKLAAGEYSVAAKAGSGIVLRRESTGTEVLVPFTERLARPTPPPAEPRLIFDAVGNFEPSYTEYFTVYLLAEVWLPGEDGYLIHVTKGAHKNEIVKGQAAKK